MGEPLICTKCSRHPRREGQQWCKFCMAAAVQQCRDRRKQRLREAREFIMQAAEFVPEPMRERARELVETL